MKGFFITLEGIDGSGKSTLTRGLTQSLQDIGLDVLATRAPGGTEIGQKIRDLILHGHLHDIKSELFLFLADRAEHVSTVIKPALAQGKIVICDRYNDSTIAYQSERGLDMSKVGQLCAYATDHLEPDLTLWVDINHQEAFHRLEKQRAKDRIENEGLYLLTKISEAYRDLAKRHDRIIALDGHLSISELLATSLDHVTQKLNDRRP
jgi:dTMP kinase